MHSGSCACGDIAYELRGEIGAAYYCHCSRCRKTSGSAFTSNAVIDPKELFIVRGEDLLASYLTAQGATRRFCSRCSSHLTVGQGDQMRLRLGTLDTPLPAGPSMHIFADSKADWFDITDPLPRHAERPPPK
jgi:hypothetical protein